MNKKDIYRYDDNETCNQHPETCSNQNCTQH